VVIKGNGVEETPFRCSPAEIGRLRDGVGQIQKKVTARLQLVPVVGIGPKPKQSASTATTAVMIEDVGAEIKVL
jgi:hypothetical protein